MARGYQLEVQPACAKWLIVVTPSVPDAGQNRCGFGAGFLLSSTIKS
jgi:hypothetical protein